MRAKPARPAVAAPSAKPSRGAERDARLRSKLAPLEPGERPGAVTVAAVVSVGLAILALVGYLTQTKIGKQSPSVSGLVVFDALLLSAAIGLWRARYWAVLGFQALLAFQIIIAALSLAVASNLLAVALTVSIIVLGGFLFWKLIRAMARIQMPERSPRP